MPAEFTSQVHTVVVQTCHEAGLLCFTNQHPTLGPYLQALAASLVVVAAIINAIIPSFVGQSTANRRITNHVRLLAKRCYVAVRAIQNSLVGTAIGESWHPYPTENLDDILEELRDTRKLEVNNETAQDVLRLLDVTMRNVKQALPECNRIISRSAPRSVRLERDLTGFFKQCVKAHDRTARCTPAGRRELARRERPVFGRILQATFVLGHLIGRRRFPTPEAARAQRLAARRWRSLRQV